MPITDEQLTDAGLAHFHAKRLALVLWVQSSKRVFRGIGRFEIDPLLGAILRILPGATAATETEPEFILCEESWRGEIVPDRLYGCDYTVDLAAAVA